jgi:diaminopropionate ammonia-lyase
VSKPRREAISAYGADVIEIPGTYDDSVEAARRVAKAHGWHLVADIAMDETDPVPALVMQGYTLLAREIVSQWSGPAPTHVFLQVGVGGLAAAVVAELGRAWGPAACRCVAVEPEKADCLYRSLRARKPQPAGGDLETVMAGLSCGDVSVPAWTVLKTAITDAVTIPDGKAIEAMRRLAFPLPGDPAIEAGESGGAGLAGLLHCGADHRLRTALDLGSSSRILLVNSEGATDPVLFKTLLDEGLTEVVR